MRISRCLLQAVTMQLPPRFLCQTDATERWSRTSLCALAKSRSTARTEDVPDHRGNCMVTSEAWLRWSKSRPCESGSFRLERVYPAMARTNHGINPLLQFSTMPRGSLLVRVEGIEPSSQAWEARILPMNYTREIVG